MQPLNVCVEKHLNHKQARKNSQITQKQAGAFFPSRQPRRQTYMSKLHISTKCFVVLSRVLRKKANRCTKVT